MTLLLSRTVLVAVFLAFMWILALLVRASGGAWWPTVIFQLHQRPGSTRPPFWGSLAVAVVAGGLAGGPAGLMSAIIVWAVVAPGWIAKRASDRAWREDLAGEEGRVTGEPGFDGVDDRPVRLRAADVRNRQRERMEEGPIDPGKPWPEYIVDAARAERQHLYQQRFDALM